MAEINLFNPPSGEITTILDTTRFPAANGSAYASQFVQYDTLVKQLEEKFTSLAGAILAGTKIYTGTTASASTTTITTTETTVYGAIVLVQAPDGSWNTPSSVDNFSVGIDTGGNVVLTNVDVVLQNANYRVVVFGAQ